MLGIIQNREIVEGTSISRGFVNLVLNAQISVCKPFLHLFGTRAMLLVQVISALHNLNFK